MYYVSRLRIADGFRADQSLSLMGMYQYNQSENADAQWAMLGSAIKVGGNPPLDISYLWEVSLQIAQNLGMSRLGAETTQHKWPMAWQDPIRREIARRIWWQLAGLVCLSYSCRTEKPVSRSTSIGPLRLRTMSATVYIQVRTSRRRCLTSTTTIWRACHFRRPSQWTYTRRVASPYIASASLSCIGSLST